MGAISTHELMTYLKISEWKALAIMRSKGFPSFRVGREWRVMEEDLNKWINERKKR